MKRFLLTLALLLAPALAHAQCNGVFPNNTVCGNITGSGNLPRPTNPSAFLGAAGGSNGQQQYNNAGALGGFTQSGDVTVNTSTGVSTIQPSAVTGSKIATGAAVKASGTGQIGDLSTLTDASINQISSAGYNAKQVPGLVPTTSTVTISNGSPAIITWASHGLSRGDTIFFCTTGALPTGLTACIPPPSGVYSANTYLQNPTLYYVVPINTNTFNLAASLADARAGTPLINTSSAGSGTQTAFANAFACGGCVGEFVWKTLPIASAFNLTSGSAGQTWNSISLSAGIWELGGSGGVLGTSGSATITHMHAGIVYGFTTIQTSPYNGSVAQHVDTNNPNGWILSNSGQQIFLTGTTTINGTVTADFTGGDVGAYGTVWARRTK